MEARRCRKHEPSCRPIPSDAIRVELTHHFAPVDQVAQVREGFAGGECQETQADAAVEHDVEYVDCALALPERFPQSAEDLLVVIVELPEARVQATKRIVVRR